MRVTSWLLGAVGLLLVGSVQARLEVTVTGGAEGALPIAVVPFGTSTPLPARDDIAKVISADLARSGRFAPVASVEMPGQPHDGGGIDFAAWRAAGIDTVVVGRVQPREGGYLVQFQLFDVLREAQLVGYAIPTRASLLRQTAHQISDIVYEKLTGERGAFNTHVAYVTVETLPDKKRRFRLSVADADGYNEQVILTSGQPLMSPAWAPEGKRLAYVSFEAGRSVIYVQDIASGRRERVAEFEGLNSAPAWSPDGRRLALTLSKDGNPEIYLLEPGSRALTRITRNFAIDTEPAWFPDGRGLVFTSDRGGRPQLYRVDLTARGAAGAPRRLTFEGDYNARAAISADGKRVAMIHRDAHGFHVAVQELESGNFTVLTQSRLDESPSFAPNGSMIIYATEVSGRGVLEAVSVDGRARQRLGLASGDVREPAWSPFFSQ